MSSMLAPVLKSALLFAGVSGLAASSQMVQQQIGWYQTAVEQGGARTAPPYIQSDQLGYALNEWRRLQQSDGLPFSDYANFLLLHPGWPGETSRRAAAETTLQSGAPLPGLAIRFFQRFPPVTPAGRLRFAEALTAAGRQADAGEQARIAWRAGLLRPNDEALLLGIFAGSLGPEDHDARMDMLLWQNAISTAQRQLSLTSAGKRSLFEARIAFRNNAADAAEKGASAELVGRSDLAARQSPERRRACLSGPAPPARVAAGAYREMV